MTRHGHGWQDQSGWIAVGFLLLVLITAAAAAFIVWADRRSRSATTSAAESAGSPPPAPESEDSGALRVLEERFARGEINAEEFLSRRRVLDTRR
jgi:putative membrane protein